jgi:hypothetical protein
VTGAYTLFEIDERSSREVRGGALVGGVLSYRIRPWLAIQPEVHFIQKGWASAEGEGGMRLTYLEVPILLRLEHPGGLKPHFMVGPSFGFEIGCSFDEMSGTGRVDCDHPLISMDRAAIDTGVMAGAGIGRSVGSGILFFDALLSIGLSDVLREPLPWGSQTNMALSLSLAYTLGLDREKGGDR